MGKNIHTLGKTLCQKQFSLTVLPVVQLKLCLLRNLHAFLLSADFFFSKNQLFGKKKIQVCHQCQTDCSGRPDLDQNCLQRLSGQESCKVGAT